jgi:hypothetical protein
LTAVHVSQLSKLLQVNYAPPSAIDLPKQPPFASVWV